LQTNSAAVVAHRELSESQQRLYEKLHQDLGLEILECLKDKEVNEVMVNPDGGVWIDSVSQGMTLQTHFTRAQRASIIHDVAGIHQFVVNQYFPHLEAELPVYKEMQGERFTGQVPPVVSAPSFSIRKRAEVIFTLEDYVKTQRLTQHQAEVLRELVAQRKNILVCGGPGSGKTTVTNALIVEAVKSEPSQRFLILEDLPELQCLACNQVSMLTTERVNMRSLLRAAMRMRPDRILIGEVRGGEALDMLKAWNTGCPGGICTVHANGAPEAIQRILDLAMEAGLTLPPIQLVHQTIEAIVSVQRQGHQKGFIQEILAIGKLQDDKFEFEKLA
jgi:type IV secretion system protein TrbB